MAAILDGKTVVAALNERLAAEADALLHRGIKPTLAIVRVGERSDDTAYERAAAARCEKIGAAVRKISLPADVSERDLTETIKAINVDDDVHACLLFRPLPEKIDEGAVCNVLKAEKDADGITRASLAAVFAGSGDGFAPCTARACMELLEHYRIDVAGKRAVVVGRSLVIGKPVAMLLLAKHATVTICHSRSTNLAEICRDADILIAAVGKANRITKEYMRPGQIVIDVGINADNAGNLTGDVNFADALSITAAVTPVPGGVGSVTTSVLAKHVINAAQKKFMQL